MEEELFLLPQIWFVMLMILNFYVTEVIFLSDASALYICLYFEYHIIHKL